MKHTNNRIATEEVYGIEEFDMNRIREIAQDVKRNNYPNGNYSEFEKEMWNILDSIKEAGYDLCMEIHRLK